MKNVKGKPVKWQNVIKTRNMTVNVYYIYNVTAEKINGKRSRGMPRKKKMNSHQKN